jgi:hypothetical protein
MPFCCKCYTEFTIVRDENTQTAFSTSQGFQNDLGWREGGIFGNAIENSHKAQTNGED